MDELDGQSVHMGHGEHGDDGLARLVGEMTVGKIIGIGKGAIGEHHTLGVSGGT